MNTKINGKNFSGKTASDVEKYLQTNIKDYKLTILENKGRQDVISGSEIGLEYRAGTEAEKLLKDQNGSPGRKLSLWRIPERFQSMCHIMRNR